MKIGTTARRTGWRLLEWGLLLVVMLLLSICMPVPAKVYDVATAPSGPGPTRESKAYNREDSRRSITGGIA